MTSTAQPDRTHDAALRRDGNRLSVMAWRNLWRNRRRTLFALASIVFGVFLAVMATAMQDRGWSEMIDLAARLGGGHVTVQHSAYQETPSAKYSLEDADAVVAAATAIDGVRRAVARILGQAMLSTARDSVGVGIVAFDPEREDASTLALLEGLVEGELFAADAERAILVGEKLARNLELELGDKVVYTLTDRDGEIVAAMARVSGILRTGSPTMDATLCLVPLQAARETLGYGAGEATQVAVFLDDQRRSELIAARLELDIVAADVAALPWLEARPDLAGFIAMKVGGARFMSVLIALLVSAGIFNTLFVSVMERLREFGIMLAIGWSPGKLFRLVMLESAWLALLGLFGAALVTAGPYLYLHSNGIDVSGFLPEGSTEIAGIGMSSRLVVGIFPSSLAGIAAAAVAAVMLSGLYPAWRAGRVDPVETLQLV